MSSTLDLILKSTIQFTTVHWKTLFAREIFVTDCHVHISTGGTHTIIKVLLKSFFKFEDINIFGGYADNENMSSYKSRG